MARLSTLAFVNSFRNSQLNARFANVGAANGYVAVPKGHPLYGKDVDDVEELGITAHGGITYAKPLTQALLDAVAKSDSDCPDARFGFANESPKTDYWVIGFDTCHGYETPEDYPLEWVVNETKLLQKQVESLA